MIPTDLPFTEIWLHDFEFVSQSGAHPDVVCLAARELVLEEGRAESRVNLEIEKE